MNKYTRRNTQIVVFFNIQDFILKNCVNLHPIRKCENPIQNRPELEAFKIMPTRNDKKKSCQPKPIRTAEQVVHG